MVFVIDEDLPRSTRTVLSALGHAVLDVRDCGLRGAPDEDVLRFAKKNQAIVLTADRGFGNLLRFPLGTHHGIIVLHLPNETSLADMNRVLIAALGRTTEDDIRGNLVVVDANKTRVVRVRRS